MDFKSLADGALVFGLSIFAVALWAWTIIVLVAGAILVFRSRGNERIFGLILIVMTLFALPQLVREYPATMAEAGVESWDRTAPHLASLSTRMRNWIGTSLDGFQPDPPAIPPTMTPAIGGLPTPTPADDQDDEAGGGAPGEGDPTQTPTPPPPPDTPQPTPLTAAASPTPDLRATVDAVATLEAPTATPEPTGWPPTPIIMTRSP